MQICRKICRYFSKYKKYEEICKIFILKMQLNAHNVHKIWHCIYFKYAEYMHKNAQKC